MGSKSGPGSPQPWAMRQSDIIAAFLRLTEKEATYWDERARVVTASATDRCAGEEDWAKLAQVELADEMRDRFFRQLWSDLSPVLKAINAAAPWEELLAVSLEQVDWHGLSLAWLLGDEG